MKDIMDGEEETKEIDIEKEFGKGDLPEEEETESEELIPAPPRTLADDDC